MFINPELIRWDGLCSLYMETLRATPVFDPATEDGEKRWNDLRNRVVEHVIAPSFYFLVMSFHFCLFELFHITEHPDHFNLLYTRTFESFK